MDEFLELTVTVECPGCEAPLAVAPGLDPLETVWLHEDECPASTFLLSA